MSDHALLIIFFAIGVGAALGSLLYRVSPTGRRNRAEIARLRAELDELNRSHRQ